MRVVMFQLAPFIITLLLTIIAGLLLIPLLEKLRVEQTVRDDGPTSHLSKMGTPTIGGLIFLLPIALISGGYAFIQPKILALIFVTIGFGVVGFIDDYIKVVKRRKDGLYASQKLIGLMIVSAIFAFYVTNTSLGTDVIIPFTGGSITVDLAWLFIPFTILVLISATNAVNITDGVDGLAAGITLIIMIFFSLVSVTSGTKDYVHFFSMCIVGGCLGFLVFNFYPARVFMGDTGSLALGGAVGSAAIVLKMPLVLMVVGVIYVIETLSVMIQVLYYKKTGKRVFKMAPIHHHFELSGWSEKKVIMVFYAVTAAVCIVTFLTL